MRMVKKILALCSIVAVGSYSSLYLLSSIWNQLHFYQYDNNAPTYCYFKDFSELLNMTFLVDTPTCKIPNIGLWDPSIIRLIDKTPSFQYDCWEKATRRWTYTEGEVLYLNETDIIRSGYSTESIACFYKPILRVNQDPKNYDFDADRIIKYGDAIAFGSKISLVPNHEFIKVICETPDDMGSILENLSYSPGRILYSQFHALPNVQIPQRKKEFWANRKKPPNILLIGIDSTSRSNFHRHMPKTEKALRQIGVVEMNGYTKVGVNTFPNMMAFSTGYSEEALLPICSPIPKEQKLDDCSFIFQHLDRLNYATSIVDDVPGLGIFNFNKIGFVEKPVDFYFRPFTVASKEGPLDGSPYTRACWGHYREDEFLLKYTKETLSKAISELGLPLYSLIWLTNYSHDYQSEIQFIDDTMARFLKALEQEGILDNSLMFFMSDHGYRYGNFRKTFSGWYEDKLPYMFIHLPKSVQSHPEYSKWTKSLQINANRLTTPFDIFHTQIQVLKEFYPEFKLEEMKDVNGIALKRIYGQSLLKLVNENRTCSEAGIPSEFCACDFPVKVRNLEDPLLIQSAEISIQEINRILEPLNKCKTFTLGRVLNGAKKEGWIIVDDSDILYSYSVIFSTKPGDFNFESTVDFFKSDSISNSTPPPKLSSRVERMDKIDTRKASCVSGTAAAELCYCSS